MALYSELRSIGIVTTSLVSQSGDLLSSSLSVTCLQLLFIY